MKTTNQMIEFVKALNKIPWRQATTITPNAEALIQDHIAKIENVINYLRVIKGLTPIESYALIQSAGCNAPEYNNFMDMLFHRVEFRGAGVREHLILVIASYYFWDEDHELGNLENPWVPMVKLYEMGYTSSFDENEGEQTIYLLIGYQGAVKKYKLI